MYLPIQIRAVCLFTVSVAVLCAGCATYHRETREPDTFRVVGYAPTYSLGQIPESAYGRVTDLIVFSAELTDDGAFCEESVAELSIERFQEMKQKHGFRIHLCYGGWERSGGFPEMTADPEKRKAFIDAVLQWCLANEFDGVDYDWEFPANDEEHAAYGRLLEETAEAFRPHGLYVTVALGHTQSLDQAAYDAVDVIHLMTYDMGYRHSTEHNARLSVERLIESGAPKDKIAMGVPFYGRRLDDRFIAMAYKHILNQFGPRPDEDEAGGFYFNNIDTIRSKTRYTVERGLGGIMIWELGMDTDDETSLLRAIQEELRR